MTSQSNEQTEDELLTALSLLIAVAACTETKLFEDWHQSLQSNIQGLMSTVNLLQKQSAFDQFQKKQIQA